MTTIAFITQTPLLRSTRPQSGPQRAFVSSQKVPQWLAWQRPAPRAALGDDGSVETGMQRDSAVHPTETKLDDTVAHEPVPDMVKTEVAAYVPSADDGFALRSTPSQGEGVFATRTFIAGDVVVPGVVVHRFSYNHSHATQVGLRSWVQHAGLNSLVNHSCDPNCGIRLNAQGGNDIVARRSIEVGDEISFDYAMRNWSIQHFPERCLCGAERCRGQITGFKDLPEQFIEDYDGFIAPYLFELRKMQGSNN